MGIDLDHRWQKNNFVSNKRVARETDAHAGRSFRLLLDEASSAPAGVKPATTVPATRISDSKFVAALPRTIP